MVTRDLRCGGAVSGKATSVTGMTHELEATWTGSGPRIRDRRRRMRWTTACQPRARVLLGDGVLLRPRCKIAVETEVLIRLLRCPDVELARRKGSVGEWENDVCREVGPRLGRVGRLVGLRPRVPTRGTIVVSVIRWSTARPTAQGDGAGVVAGLRWVVCVEGPGRGLEGPPGRKEVRLGVEGRRRVLTGSVEETTKRALVRWDGPVSARWEVESSDRAIPKSELWVRCAGRTRR